jgi:alpha-glucosidase
MNNTRVPPGAPTTAGAGLQVPVGAWTQEARIKSLHFILLALILQVLQGSGAQQRVVAPGGGLAITISDTGGLNYRVEVNGSSVITNSALGLEFKDGAKLGPQAAITKAAGKRIDEKWENRFGNRRVVRNNCREMRLTLEERGTPRRTFGLVVRAYDDGVAFRYDLPVSSGLGSFVLTNELTEFHFADDYRCWFGEESSCAENRYPAATLSTIPRGRQNTLPLLVETPAAFVAVAEADLLDWAGMFTTGTGSPVVRARLASRKDRNGLVVSEAPRLSPWRVLMIGRKAAEMVGSDLIASLATSNLLGDVSWVKPGACAWDPWWTGANTNLPQFTGVNARGDTATEKEYIDFAAEMGWPYQLLDWNWYRRDPTMPEPHMNIPEVFAHAKARGVGIFIWLQSGDLTRVGFEKVLSLMKDWGAIGVKVDFMNSDSQETVKWYEDVLKIAAQHKLMVDFHGAYKPTGLARTYPNYITQEGVLGNEYNKLTPNGLCSISHTITLPFTRGLLGPMDFTPGGFINRAPADFRTTFPAQVMGTRARQLAMTVTYLSPLLVLCDSPKNYRGQPGIEFLRQMPTVWDDTVVISGEVGKTLVLARRAGDRWYIAAMNGDDAAQISVPLKFLGKGKWKLRAFADKTDSSNYEAIVESNGEVGSQTNLPLSLLPGGGFAGIFTKSK